MDKKADLDKIDQKILRILQVDGRISYQKLSEQVNLTPRPCQERVRRLEALGVIAGYKAVIKPQRLERSIIVLAQIALADHARSQPPFENEMRSNEAVLDCWLISGTFDFMVRLACRDLEHYRAIANSWLVSTAFTIEKIVTTTELEVIKRGD